MTVEDNWRLSSYSFAFRCGDFRYNAGTIYHLHGHVVVGDGSDNKVRFAMSSAPK